jgi:dolichyl-phosphate beta-glucosyltransferase
MLFLTLILPAFNEVARISETIRDAQMYFEARGHSYEIIVVADGDDGTWEVVRKISERDPKVHVRGSRERRGKGHAIREAARVARGAIIGFVDADNKTPIDEFDKFVNLLQDCDVAIGSRAEPGSRIEQRQPVHRRIGSKLFALFMHAVVGLHDIKDTQCGFKFFRREAALDLFHHQRIDGYMFDVEILYLAQCRGYRIAQVPVRWKDDADSRLQLFRGNLRNGLDVLRIPRLHKYLWKKPARTEIA